MGWTRVEVVKCLDGNVRIEENGGINHPEISEEYRDDIESGIAEEIKTAMVGEKKPLTPEGKKIAEMEKKMAEMEKLLKERKVEPKKEAVKIQLHQFSNGEIEGLRAKYEEVFNKKPHHKMGLDKLKSEIESKLIAQ